MTGKAPRKRLIVCCDGTWQDSTADDLQPPSNVTRLSRAISRNAIVDENGEKKTIPQIVYYQKGVGTGFNAVDKLLGGAAGMGLSANVRSAYGFLADNYTEGDQIYFFGFSRGAYTARAVAGLVLELGLLTSRGMDNFSIVYNDFYKNQSFPDYDEDKRRRLGFRHPRPDIKVEIIGVWDTVAFHKTRLARLLGIKEEIEFRNTVLHEDVNYAFHALSLDENRTAFQPTLWHIPEGRKNQELTQVWFSGVHTDIGGGAPDPRLSNITLAWMIAHCRKTNLLSFNIDGYLFDNPPKPIEPEPDTVPWATSRGPNKIQWSFEGWFETTFLGTSARTPLAYKPRNPSWKITNERIHESVKDRGCVGQAPTSVPWPCLPIRARPDAEVYALTDDHEIDVVEASEGEKYMKGRIRTVHPDKED